jgi:hypothetical protein
VGADPPRRRRRWVATWHATDSTRWVWISLLFLQFFLYFFTFFWLQIAQMAWVCASLLAAAAASTFFFLHPPISVCFGPELQKLAGRKNWVVEHPAGFSQNQQNSDEFTEEH